MIYFNKTLTLSTIYGTTLLVKGGKKMTKKQILATCLAGALTLGCISGCANKKVEAKKSGIESILINEDEIR